MGSVDLDPSGFSGTLDDITDGSTYKKISITEADRLATCNEDAEENPVNLAALDSTAADKLALTIITDPIATEHKVETIQRKASGEINFIFNDTPES